MKLLLTIITYTLLLVNGLGALFGGYHLISHPDGSSLQMPLSMLATTPFTNFLIPGVILFVANGLFSMAVLSSLLLKKRYSALLIIGQGVVLFSWICIQVVLIRGVHALHFIFGGIGLALITCGSYFNKTLASQVHFD